MDWLKEGVLQPTNRQANNNDEGSIPVIYTLFKCVINKKLDLGTQDSKNQTKNQY